MNKIDYEIENHMIIVHFYGEVDCNHVYTYRNELAVLFEQTHGDVVFDFSHTSFIDSSGIGLVLGRYNQLKFDKRNLILTGLSPVTYHIFDLTGLFTIMPYYQSLKEAKEEKQNESNGVKI